MNPLVSVIVPVYNVAPYLRQCMDSIVNQTLKDIEIICVDDGSTDDSLAILLEYAAADNRVRVLQQENKGGGAARNLGMSIATGEYVIFLDSDDFFELEMLQLSYEKGEKNGADIIIFGYKDYNNDTKVIANEVKGINFGVIPRNIPFSCNDLGKHIFDFVQIAPWTKLYNARFLHQINIKYMELFKNNDTYFGLCSIYYAEKIDLVLKPLAYYRINMKTSTQATIFKHPLDIYYALIETKNKLESDERWVNNERYFCDTAIKLLNIYLRKYYGAFPHEYKILRELLSGGGTEKLAINKYVNERGNSEYKEYQYHMLGQFKKCHIYRQYFNYFQKLITQTILEIKRCPTPVVLRRCIGTLIDDTRFLLKK